MSPEERQALLSKIKKCLALSESSSSNEAATALRQAQALMQRAGISPKEVEASIAEDEMIRTTEGFGQCLFLRLVTGMICDAFGVRGMMERNPGVANRANIRYFGVDGRAQMACYAHAVITRAVNASWKQFLVRFPHLKEAGAREAFRIGWLQEVKAKVMAIGIAPEHVGPIDALVKRTYKSVSELRTINRKLSEDEILIARHGQAAGKKFDLHRPMNADPSRPKTKALSHD